MRKTALFAAAVALALTGIGTWFGVRTFIATRALAGSHQRLAPADPAILRAHLKDLQGKIALP